MEIESDTANKAGGFVAFGWVDDEAGGFVENEEAIVFVDDVEEFARLQNGEER